MKFLSFLTIAFALAFATFTTSCEKANATQTSVLGSGFTSLLTAYNIGETVTDFNLKNIDGSMVSLSNYPSAKGFVVVFTSNSCPYSEMVEDRVISLANDVKAKGYEVILINPNNSSVEAKDSFEAMQKRAQAKGYKFPYLQDADGKVAESWKVARLPQFYVIQQTVEGKILQYAGALDDNIRKAGDVTENYVKEVINSIENGNEIHVTTTRSFGCSIKSK